MADTLSRATLANIQLGIDYLDLSQAQKDDSEVQACRHSKGSKLQLEDIPYGSSEDTTVLCDISTGSPRPVVPTTWRRRVFDLIHGLSHPSVRTTRKLVTSRFVWNGVQKQVGTWAKME